MYDSEYFERERRNMPSQRPIVGLGSGFIIDDSGIVVTNNHVIEAADEIKIILNDSSEYTADLLGRDPKADLAVLKFNANGKKLKSVEWGNSDTARIGDPVIAIGNPLGIGNSVTSGIISAISRDIGFGPYVKFIQTDASINKGNSGGPLFNGQGKVIGINTAILSQTGGSIGLGFAIPSNSATKIIYQLKEFGKTKRGYLGVEITNVTEDIAYTGDIPINKMSDLPRLVAESDVGMVSIVEIWRKNKIINIKVKLGELPEKSYVTQNTSDNINKEIEINDLGISIIATDNDEGVIIKKIEENSNLKFDDIIIEVNREKITTVEIFIELVEQIKKTGRNSLLLKIIRGDKTLWETVKYKN